jgi:hypothetical protein
MTLYKRNQIEEAIFRTWGAPAHLKSELRTRIKRLLDMDRGLTRRPQSHDPELAHYAFYSDDSPGRGVEVWFSDYEAFAIMTGLRLLEQGLPQRFPVGLLRRFRPELEGQHARILRQDPTELFDIEQIRRTARAGDLAFDNIDPVFLIIVSDRRASIGSDPRTLSCAVCRGMKQVGVFLRQEGARSYSLHELATPAHKLHSELSQVHATKRGRGA